MIEMIQEIVARLVRRCRLDTVDRDEIVRRQRLLVTKHLDAENSPQDAGWVERVMATFFIQEEMVYFDAVPRRLLVQRTVMPRPCGREGVRRTIGELQLLFPNLQIEVLREYDQMGFSLREVVLRGYDAAKNVVREMPALCIYEFRLLDQGGTPVLVGERVYYDSLQAEAVTPMKPDDEPASPGAPPGGSAPSPS